jgi:hypothetical protein
MEPSHRPHDYGRTSQKDRKEGEDSSNHLSEISLQYLEATEDDEEVKTFQNPEKRKSAKERLYRKHGQKKLG